jgi:hypothetical protein
MTTTTRTNHVIEFVTPETANEPAPWPVLVDDEGTVRSGLGEWDNAALVGFGPAGQQTVTVFREQDPASVVGMTPTFSDGNLFVWDIPVREFRAVEEVCS